MKARILAHPLLGTVPDRVVAADLGCSRGYVAWVRLGMRPRQQRSRRVQHWRTGRWVRRTVDHLGRFRREGK